MTDADFQHLRLSMVKDVAVVEIRTKEIHGPQLARELGHELATVTAQDWAKRVLVNFRRVTFLSSTGFAAMFKLVSRARVEGREVKLCAMEPGVRLGAEIVGLDKVAEIHDDEGAALRAFARSRAVAGGVRPGRASLPAIRDPEEARQEPRPPETSDGPGRMEPAGPGAER